MSCTKEEIAEKKRIALERLKAKKQSMSASLTVTKESSTFYGKSNEENALNITKKVTTNPYQNARILSQPYHVPKSSNQTGFASTTYSIQDKKQQVAPIFSKIISCTCCLITETRFVVIPSGYHGKLIEVFKTISSRGYDASSKTWSFHLCDYNLVQERVGALKPDIVIGPLPKFVLNLFNQPDAEKTDISLGPIEKTVTNVLMPFQEDGVRFGIEKKGRVMIADEMGLGKTYQAIALADFYKADWPLLVCTTASTRNTWQTKVRELLPYVACHHIVCMTSGNDYVGEAKVVITSYNLMDRHNEMLLQKEFGFVIFDESHSLKNFKAKVTETAAQLARIARRVVLLTGTPALSRPLELFTQLQMIDKYYFTFKEYTSRYCDGKQTNFGWDASGQSNLNELNLVLSRKFMIRRTKQDVLTQLKEKFRETVLLDPALIWTKDETAENMKSYATDLMKLKGKAKEDVLLKFYNETAHAKSKAVCHYVKGIVKEGKKFIIFGHHRVMLDAISECLLKMNVDFIRIDGTTKNDIRTIHVKRFQENPKCLVAVLSIKACNAGITLTAAQLVIFAELDWNPSILAQAESRAHRIGQDGDVICRYLMAKGTADDTIWEMLKSKQNVLNKAGVFNEDLSDATNVIGPSTSHPITTYFKQTDDIKGSQSSIDEIIASMCTDDIVAESSTKDSTVQVSKNRMLPDKENISNDLSGFFDADDEVFAGLEY